MDLENRAGVPGEEEGVPVESVLVLTDEDGAEVEFEFADLLEYEGVEYVFLLPLDEEDTNVVILQVEPDPDDPETENYLAIDDEALLETLFALFKERNKDDYIFE